MEPIKTIIPVWVLNTKSWWLGAFPAVLSFVDYLFQVIDSEQAVPFANAIAMVLALFGSKLTGLDITDFIRGIAPLYVALVIMWQRRGINQPYVATPEKVNKVIEVVQDGRALVESAKSLTGKIRR